MQQRKRCVAILGRLSHPGASMDDLSAMRRSFRTHQLQLCPTRGSTPGWYAVPRWGTPKPSQPAPAQAHPKPGRSGVRPERALEANTPTPRAQRESSSFPEPPQRAQAHPKPGRSGVRPKRALEANTPTPSRTARKLLLPRASSASAGPPKTRGGAVSGRSEPWRRTLQPHRA